jgi:hypothetical protein
MIANANDRSGHSHRDHAVLTLSAEQEAPPVVDDVTLHAGEPTPDPVARPNASAMLFVRGPEVLRSLARVALIAVQFWRA